MFPDIQVKKASIMRRGVGSGDMLAVSFLKGIAHVCARLSPLLPSAGKLGTESGGCPVCMGPAGSAVISNRQAGSFQESFSKG